MTYQTPALADTTSARADITIKKSEFFAFAYTVTSRDAVNMRMAELREQFPDARHHCMGYIIGNPDNTTSAGFDDDGEPSGTAGKPILNVLQHKKIGNCCIIVVRYFGGIKLGAGGLTRAYAQSAQAVIDVLPLQDHVPLSHIHIASDFATEAQVRHFVGVVNGHIIDVIYTADVTLQVSVATARVNELAAHLSGSAAHIVDDS